MRVIKNGIVVAVVLIILTFTVANMAPVRVVLDPFGLGVAALAPIQAPLAFVALGFVAVGMILGVVLMRLALWDALKNARRHAAEVKALHKENARLREALKAADHPASIALPASRRVA